MSATMDIKVSVIVPVYNAGQTLEICLQEILGQTLRETEIICVDDGSTDDSLSVLERYREKDGRMRVIRQDHQGAGTARNAGMAEARGEYMLFLDADDRFEPDLLQKTYALCRETGADICACRADTFNVQTGHKGSYPAAFTKPYIPERNPFVPASDETCETVLQMFNGVPWNKLFRTAFVRETGLKYQSLRTTNDAFFVYSALCRAGKIATLDRVLVHHRKNAGTSLTDTRDQSWTCFYEALVAIRDELERCGLYRRFERTFVNRALQSVFWNMDTVSPGCAEKIAELMKREGFARLGIDGHDAGFFHEARLFERYHLLRNLDWKAFQAAMKIVQERDALDHENQKLQKEIASFRSSLCYRVGKTLSSIPRFFRGRRANLR